MRAVWSVPVTLALAIVMTGSAQAQQPPYPAQFTEQWTNSCVSACQNNGLYKGRQGVCAAYCNCIVQQSQASIPLEVAIQADKDLAAKNNNSPAVQRVSQVTNQCQSRYAQQPNQMGKQNKATR